MVSVGKNNAIVDSRHFDRILLHGEISIPVWQDQNHVPGSRKTDSPFISNRMENPLFRIGYFTCSSESLFEIINQVTWIFEPDR